MNESIPDMMEALVLKQEGAPPAVERIPVPTPGPGEVLVRMAASPINPSDLANLVGGFGYERALPAVPGIEGSGKVVGAGPGLFGSYLVGKRVACARSPQHGGTWAEYMVTRAMNCMPLFKSVSLAQGAMLIVNPMTALAFFDILKRGRHAAFVNTAAASALGRMLVRLARARRVPIINIVRRSEQAAMLRSMGAEHVLVSTEAGFDEALRELCRRLRATLILDAITGEFTQVLVKAAPKRSTILLYSALSGQPSQVMPNTLWHDDKRIEGFYLSAWIARQSPLKILSLIIAVQRMSSAELHTEIRELVPLSAIQEALSLYQQDMAAGKLLLAIDPEQLAREQTMPRFQPAS